VTYAADVLALGPAGYWRMGAASGAEPDLGAGGHALTITGATRDVTGPTALGADDDGAVSFDGASNFGSVTLDLSDAATITWAAWGEVPRVPRRGWAADRAYGQLE
jgi:hypothetical protein